MKKKRDLKTEIKKDIRVTENHSFSCFNCSISNFFRIILPKLLRLRPQRVRGQAEP